MFLDRWLHRQKIFSVEHEQRRGGRYSTPNMTAYGKQWHTVKTQTTVGWTDVNQIEQSQHYHIRWNYLFGMRSSVLVCEHHVERSCRNPPISRFLLHLARKIGLRCLLQNQNTSLCEWKTTKNNLKYTNDHLLFTTSFDIATIYHLQLTCREIVCDTWGKKS